MLLIEADERTDTTGSDFDIMDHFYCGTCYPDGNVPGMKALCSTELTGPDLEPADQVECIVCDTMKICPECGMEFD